MKSVWEWKTTAITINVCTILRTSLNTDNDIHRRINLQSYWYKISKIPIRIHLQIIVTTKCVIKLSCTIQTSRGRLSLLHKATAELKRKFLLTYQDTTEHMRSEHGEQKRIFNVYYSRSVNDVRVLSLSRNGKFRLSLPINISGKNACALKYNAGHAKATSWTWQMWRACNIYYMIPDSFIDQAN